MLEKLIRILTIIVTIVLIGWIVFLKLPKTSIDSKEVVADISASDLYTAFIDNEKAAEIKYLGKAVLIHGLIDDKYEDENGAPVLILQSATGDPVALVTLEVGQKSKIISYSIGDKIKIKALCSGILMEVTLSKGMIVEN